MINGLQNILIFFLMTFPLLSYGEVNFTDDTHSKSRLEFKFANESLILSKRDVASIELDSNHDANVNCINLTLRPDAEKKLTKMSKINLGKNVKLIFDDFVLSNSKIIDELGGRFIFCVDLKITAEKIIDAYKLN